MLPKNLRLSAKDINYMTKKNQKWYGKFFGFFRIPQYVQKKFHQIGVQIPVLISKSSVNRNQVKRIVFHSLSVPSMQKHWGQGNYYKIFVIVNKKAIDELKKIIDLSEKKTIQNEIKKFFEKDFSDLQYHLGAFSTKSNNTGVN
ncbi:MAG TPA: ribonuclease P protein component [Candidatus Absconditabacterales bacterium]|nr:ribonuclease P protein component [Candidatus Absconditabacterales bacterium]